MSCLQDVRDRCKEMAREEEEARCRENVVLDGHGNVGVAAVAQHCAWCTLYGACLPDRQQCWQLAANRGIGMASATTSSWGMKPAKQPKKGKKKKKKKKSIRLLAFT